MRKWLGADTGVCKGMGPYAGVWQQECTSGKGWLRGYGSRGVQVERCGYWDMSQYIISNFTHRTRFYASTDLLDIVLA